MTVRAENRTEVPALGAVALLACTGLVVSTGTASAALNSATERAPSGFLLPESEDLVAQLAENLGVEALKPKHAVQWQVAQASCSSFKSCDTISDPGGTRQDQIITNRILTQVLLGANEQINCSNCFSAFGSVGSYSMGAHGRYNITSQLSIRGGIAFSQYHGSGYRITSAPILAAALRYDLADWGWSRPFFDVGITATPSQQGRYTRTYMNFGVPVTGVGKADSNSYAGFIKGGWVFRLTQRDEAAIYGELWRSWQRVSSYTENPVPPMGAFPSTNDSMNIVKFGAQWTHLWGSQFETHLNVGVARTFDTKIGFLPMLAGLGSPVANVGERTYFEYGARVGYRITPKMTVDLFANGAAGDGPSQVHVGTALRFSY